MVEKYNNEWTLFLNSIIINNNNNNNNKTIKTVCEWEWYYEYKDFNE